MHPRGRVGVDERERAVQLDSDVRPDAGHDFRIAVCLFAGSTLGRKGIDLCIERSGARIQVLESC